MQSFSSASAAGLSSKRVRGAAGSGSQQVASCLVDGCKSDLSKCRDYHRRHKVCEAHSKTPTVTIGGLEQRFCQQCSRFHSLGEFDEGKRSCRKRLEGHNRRRRKPPPDTYSGMNPGNFLSGGGRGGGRLLSFGGGGAPIIADGSGVWSAPALSGETSLSPSLYSSHSQHQLDMAGGGGDHGNNHHHHRPSSTSSSSYNARPFRGRQFPFLQCPPEPSLPAAAGAGASSSSSPNYNNNEQQSNNNSNNNNSHKNNMFSDEGLNQVIDQSGRRRALSLLSSSSSSPPSSHHGAPDNAANNASSVAPGFGFSRLIHGHPNPMAHVHHHHPVRPQQQQNHHLVSAAGISYDGHHFACSSSPQGMDHHQNHHHHHFQSLGGGGGAVGFRSSNQVDVFQGSTTAGSDQGSSSASGSHQTLSFSWE